MVQEEVRAQWSRQALGVHTFLYLSTVARMVLAYCWLMRTIAMSSLDVNSLGGTKARIRGRRGASSSDLQARQGLT